MHRPMSAILCAVLLMFSANTTWTQTAQKKAESPGGSISGRVTFNGQPMPETTVVLQPERSGVPSQNTSLQAATDEEGRFRITRVPAGRYVISPLALGLVMSGDTTYGRGRSIAIAEGETLEGIDFELTPGGVITGKVTDADGQPLIDERLTLIPISAGGYSGSSATSFMLSTDDRGEYRLFGLPAGRYLISVGTEVENISPNSAHSDIHYPRTFYHNVTDQAQATPIEVTPGKEARADIVMRAIKTYTVLARVVDGTTGEPIPRIYVGYRLLKEGSPAPTSVPNPTDDKGEAVMPGITPGRYMTLIATFNHPGYYTDPVNFEVVGENTPPVEIKAYRGASISGVVSLENGNDPTLLAQLTRLTATITSSSPANPRDFFSSLTIQPDGSFRVTGLRPGKVTFGMVQSGFFLLRVERDGAEQRNGQITVGENEQVTGVRLILGYGTGIIRGQIQTTGEAPPEGFTLRVSARLVGATLSTTSGRSAQVDAKGSFVLDGLIPGNWEIVASAIFNPPPIKLPTPIRPVFVRQTVTVTNGAATQVTLMLNLKP